MIYEELSNELKTPSILTMMLFFPPQEFSSERWDRIIEALISVGFKHPGVVTASGTFDSRLRIQAEVDPHGTITESHKHLWDQLKTLALNNSEIFEYFFKTQSILACLYMVPTGLPKGFEGKATVGWIEMSDPASQGYSDAGALKVYSNLVGKLIEIVENPIMGYIGHIDGLSETYDEYVGPDNPESTDLMENELLEGNMIFFGIVNFLSNEMVEKYSNELGSLEGFTSSPVEGKGQLIWMRPEYFDRSCEILRQAWKTLGIPDYYKRR